VSRIRQHTQRVAADHPDVEFLAASYLGDHPLVIDTFRDRIYEALQGDTAMNCSLCKYRSDLLGFESEVGLVQESHHHHVEGLTDSCTLCEQECTGACQPDGRADLFKEHDHDHAAAHAHDHSHGHYPYPHAEHPLGPISLKKPTTDES